MKQFIDIAVAERPKGFYLVLHGSFDTLENIVKMSRYASSQGVEALLLAYPPFFYPTKWEDLYEFTAEIAGRTDQAIVLFAVSLWGFRRLDPRGFPIEALKRMAELDTVIALKYEVGGPGNGGIMEIHDLLAKKLLISDPFEAHAPGCIRHYDMQWMGTSNYEYTADRVPRMFDLMRRNHWNEAMQIYWSNNQQGRRRYS